MKNSAYSHFFRVCAAFFDIFTIFDNDCDLAHERRLDCDGMTQNNVPNPIPHSVLKKHKSSYCLYPFLIALTRAN